MYDVLFTTSTETLKTPQTSHFFTSLFIFLIFFFLKNPEQEYSSFFPSVASAKIC